MTLQMKATKTLFRLKKHVKAPNKKNPKLTQPPPQTFMQGTGRAWLVIEIHRDDLMEVSSSKHTRTKSHGILSRSYVGVGGSLELPRSSYQGTEHRDAAV